MANQKSARKLLERLASDDDFRALMEKSPVAAFAEYGIHVDARVAPEKIVLPSKEEIDSDIELLSQQIEHSAGFIIFAR
jgi:putative modified peptide